MSTDLVSRNVLSLKALPLTKCLTFCWFKLLLWNGSFLSAYVSRFLRPAKTCLGKVSYYQQWHAFYNNCFGIQMFVCVLSICVHLRIKTTWCTVIQSFKNTKHFKKCFLSAFFAGPNRWKENNAFEKVSSLQQLHDVMFL